MSDKIAAIATGRARTGIGILRLSGDGCIEAAGQVFRLNSGRPLTSLPDRKLALGTLFDAQGRPIDHCMAFISRAPHSYTGEDTAEIQCHGSPAALTAGLEALFAAGFRQARPGEFTRRAFLNGQMDLTQAEAVIDLIDAETADAAANAAGQVAGAIRKTPVELTPCISIKENAVANAEYVIEGEIQPGVKVIEDQNTHTGYAMPEFPGYNGAASHECWLIKVKAVTHRENPIMQTVIGPSEEHVNLAGIPTEASIFNMIDKALPGKVTNVYAHPSGGGKYMAVLQCKKMVHTDEGKQRQAALLAFSAFPELKHVILVDEDVDIFDTRDVLWAMNTRFQGDKDIITIPGVRCHPLDPSSDPEYSTSILDRGISCKTIFDCTVPFELKNKFVRAKFMDVDKEKWKEFI